MDVLKYLYLHAPQMIQITGIALLVAGCIPALGLPRRTARTVKHWQIQVDSHGLPDDVYCFCAYRRFGKYRVQVTACPAYTAVIQPELASRNGILELRQGFTSLSQATEAANAWAERNQRRLTEGV